MIFLVWFGCVSSSAPEDWIEVPQLFAAGFRDISFVDHRGKELTATIWYPASVQEGNQVDSYDPFQIALEGYRSAPLAVTNAPLIAFSHGFYAIRFQSAYLMEHLAQRGYVVIAVDHPNNVLYDFDDQATAQVLLERPDDVRSSVDELIRKSNDQGDPLFNSIDDSRYIAMGHSFGSHTANVLGGR